MTLLSDELFMRLLFTILLQFPTDDTNSHEEKVNGAEENQLVQQKKMRGFVEKWNIDWFFKIMLWLMA